MSDYSDPYYTILKDDEENPAFDPYTELNAATADPATDPAADPYTSLMADPQSGITPDIAALFQDDTSGDNAAIQEQLSNIDTGMTPQQKWALVIAGAIPAAIGAMRGGGKELGYAGTAGADAMKTGMSLFADENKQRVNKEILGAKYAQDSNRQKAKTRQAVGTILLRDRNARAAEKSKQDWRVVNEPKIAAAKMSATMPMQQQLIGARAAAENQNAVLAEERKAKAPGDLASPQLVALTNTLSEAQVRARGGSDAEIEAVRLVPGKSTLKDATQVGKIAGTLRIDTEAEKKRNYDLMQGYPSAVLPQGDVGTQAVNLSKAQKAEVMLATDYAPKVASYVLDARAELMRPGANRAEIAQKFSAAVIALKNQYKMGANFTEMEGNFIRGILGTNTQTNLGTANDLKEIISRKLYDKVQPRDSIKMLDRFLSQNAMETTQTLTNLGVILNVDKLKNSSPAMRRYMATVLPMHPDGAKFLKTSTELAPRQSEKWNARNRNLQTSFTTRDAEAARRELLDMQGGDDGE